MSFKVIIKRKNSNYDFLICILLLCCAFSYFGYWYTAVISRTYVYYVYTNTVANILLASVRYLDDVLFMLLGVILWSKRISKKLVEWFCVGLIWGLAGLLIGERFSLGYMLCGIRCFINFFIMVQWYKVIDKNKLNYKLVIRIMNFIVICQMIGCILLSRYCNAYRTPGFFGNAGTLGIFLMGAMLLYYVVFLLGREMDSIEYIVIQLVILICCLLADSRSAIVVFFLLNCFALLLKLRISKRLKAFIGLIWMAIMMPCAIFLASNISNRTSIVQANLQGGGEFKF